MANLSFYDVNQDYIDYLRQHDRQIPDIRYTTNNKFVCGVVLTINGFNYFAPVSSFNVQQRTNFVIVDKGRNISSIRFCFMFPIPDSEISIIDFSTKSSDYANLLSAELRYCNWNIPKIIKKAEEVYKIGIDKKHPLNKTCCDFKLLEQLCAHYDKMETHKDLHTVAEVVQKTIDKPEGKKIG